MKETRSCTICDKETNDYCNDVVCRSCHKTESLEDCLADKQLNAIRREYGLPERIGEKPC